MSKNDKVLISLAALAVVGAATVAMVNWLESSPNCDKGCRTQLEHLKEHILEDLLRAALPKLGMLFG